MDPHVTGLVEAVNKIETILDDNDVYGIVRAFGSPHVADELVEWVEQAAAHRIQIGVPHAPQEG